VVIGKGWNQFQIRVPMDDTNTLQFWYNARDMAPGTPVQNAADIQIWDNPWRNEAGRFILDTLNGQDMTVMITQGDVSDRTTERLGTSDQGVILYRNTLLEQIDRVERGEDPLGVVRDPAKNTPWIETPREEEIRFSTRGARASARDMAPQLPAGGKPVE
jgi:5,5'-dehydrodivanillate O-demethylase